MISSSASETARGGGGARRGRGRAERRRWPERKPRLLLLLLPQPPTREDAAAEERVEETRPAFLSPRVREERKEEVGKKVVSFLVSERGGMVLERVSAPARRRAVGEQQQQQPAAAVSSVREFRKSCFACFLAPWLQPPSAPPCAERVNVCRARRGALRDSRDSGRAPQAGGEQRLSLFFSRRRERVRRRKREGRKTKQNVNSARRALPSSTYFLSDCTHLRERRAWRGRRRRAATWRWGELEVFF